MAWDCKDDKENENMKNLFLLLIVTVTLCSCFASTRYVRIEISGKGSYNPLLGSINIEQGGISIYKAVSNDDKMIAPEGFFDERTNN